MNHRLSASKTLKTLSFALLTLSVTACASHSLNERNSEVTLSKQDTRCQDPRPEICTREYRPVCALVEHDQGEQEGKLSRKTYATWCTACADSRVKGYSQGECPSADI